MKENFIEPSIAFRMRGTHKRYAIKDIPSASKLVFCSRDASNSIAIADLWLQPYDADHMHYLDQCSKLN